MRLVALLVALVACNREPKHVSIGVAASLRHAMPELVERYRNGAGVELDVTYGASDVLADQITHGAALDALVLAEAGALDALIAANEVTPSSRRVVATNRIVLVGPADSRLTFASLATLPEGARIAVGDPASVPAGRYARRYFETLGIWEALQPRMIFGGDVAAVLALAQQGRARVAVVYRTDAKGAAPLVVLDEPADAPTASVVAGVATHSRHAAAARAFGEFLASPEGQQILARHGFAPPAR
jgi:molybdate transport system substrate-binding protein